MSGVSLSGSIVNNYDNSYQNKSTTKTAVAEKDNFKDNVVHISDVGSFSKDDFVAATNNAKDSVIFLKNDKGDIYKIDLSANPDFINEVLNKLSGKENFNLKINLPSDCIPGKQATQQLKEGKLSEVGEKKETIKKLESMGVNLKDGLNDKETGKIIEQLKFEGAPKEKIDQVVGQINEEIDKFKRVGSDGKKEKVSQELKIDSPDANSINYTVDEKTKGPLKVDVDLKLPGIDVDVKKEGKLAIKKTEDGEIGLGLKVDGKFAIKKTEDGKFDIDIKKEGKFAITKTEDGKFDVGLGLKVERGADKVITLRSAEKIEEKMNLGDGKNLKKDLEKLGINIENGIGQKELDKIVGKLEKEDFSDLQVHEFIRTKLDPILPEGQKLIKPPTNLDQVGPSQELKDLVAKTKTASGSEQTNVINQDEATAIKNQIVKDLSGLKSEVEISAYMAKVNTFLSSEEGLNINTNVKFTSTIDDHSNDLQSESKYSFEISGKTTETIPGTKEPDQIKMNFGVTDYLQKATADANDGKDPQFSVLAEKGATKNGTDGFLKVDNKGQIQGVFDGWKDYGGANSTKKLADLPAGVPTEIKEVIKADFLRYAKEFNKPTLTEVFPMNAEGKFDDKVVESLMTSMKSVPGNSENPNITKENATELLSYIHKGTNTEGKTNVQQLQTLLNSTTGGTGEKISDYNHERKGDDQYGYATTLQVRSLGASVEVIPGKTTEPVTTEKKVEASASGALADKYNISGDNDDPKTKPREIRIPTLDISLDPHFDVKLPKFKVEVPKFDVDVDIKLPKFKVEVPNIDVDVDIKLPKFEVETPTVTMDPKFKLPKFELETPKIDVDVTTTKGKFDINIGREKGTAQLKGGLELRPDVEIPKSVDFKPEYPTWKFDLNQKYDNDWITNDQNLFDPEKTKLATQALDAGYNIKIAVSGDKKHLTDAGLGNEITKLKEKPANINSEVTYASYFKDQSGNIMARKSGGEIDVYNKEGTLLKSFDKETLTKQRASSIEASSENGEGFITINSSASISPSTRTLGSKDGVPEEFKPSFEDKTVDNDKLSLGRGAEMAKDMIEAVFKDSGMTKEAFLTEYGTRTIEFVAEAGATIPKSFDKNITVAELFNMYNIGGGK